MPLGVVSDEDFEKECKHISIPDKGRGNTKEIPEVIREVIAEEAIAGDSKVVDIASRFGVSTASVSAYKHDATSTASYNEPDQRLRKKNDQVRDTIISSAREKLLSALSEITPEKLKDAKLRDVASVAKDMSAVINNTSPNHAPSGVAAQFIFHVPKTKQESDFEIIDVKG